MRITNKDIEKRVLTLNDLAGTPKEPYAKIDGKFEPQAKCYHLSFAYGGVALHQMCDEGSGVRDIFGGHMPKRELYERLNAFINGFGSAKREG